MRGKEFDATPNRRARQVGLGGWLLLCFAAALNFTLWKLNA
jgi:hypothetical protein